MKRSALILQKRAEKIEAQRALHATAEGEKRSLNETETVEFRSLQQEIEKLTGEYNDALAYEENLRSLEGSEETEFTPAGEQRGSEKPRFSLHRAIRSQMSGSAHVVLAGAELDVHQRAVQSVSNANIAVTGFGIQMRAAQTVTGDSGGYGGNLVATELQDPIDFLRPEPLMKKLGATYLTGLQGNLRYPKNEGGIVATWEGETDETDSSANAYGYVDSLPKRLSVTVPISLQNLMQSNIDLEIYTMKEINAAIENAIDAAAINLSLIHI